MTYLRLPRASPEAYNGPYPGVLFIDSHLMKTYNKIKSKCMLFDVRRSDQYEISWDDKGPV